MSGEMDRLNGEGARQGAPEKQTRSNDTRLNPDTKRAAVLRVFLERGDAGLNCFEAVRLAHDYVLRTTVSEAVRYNGVAFHKAFEAVPGHNGSRVDCIRYKLTAEGTERARQLLGCGA